MDFNLGTTLNEPSSLNKQIFNDFNSFYIKNSNTNNLNNSVLFNSFTKSPYFFLHNTSFVKLEHSLYKGFGTTLELQLQGKDPNALIATTKRMSVHLGLIYNYYCPKRNYDYYKWNLYASGSFSLLGGSFSTIYDGEPIKNMKIKDDKLINQNTNKPDSFSPSYVAVRTTEGLCAKKINLNTSWQIGLKYFYLKNFYLNIGFKVNSFRAKNQTIYFSGYTSQDALRENIPQGFANIPINNDNFNLKNNQPIMNTDTYWQTFIYFGIGVNLCKMD